MYILPQFLGYKTGFSHITTETIDTPKTTAKAAL